MEQLIVELRGAVARLEGVIATLNETLVARDERIAKLEELLEDSRRSGKRQAAPFSKGDPADEPKPPGRKSRQATRPPRTSHGSDRSGRPRARRPAAGVLPELRR